MSPTVYSRSHWMLRKWQLTYKINGSSMLVDCRTIRNCGVSSAPLLRINGSHCSHADWKTSCIAGRGGYIDRRVSRSFTDGIIRFFIDHRVVYNETIKGTTFNATRPPSPHPPTAVTPSPGRLVMPTSPGSV